MPAHYNRRFRENTGLPAESHHHIVAERLGSKISCSLFCVGKIVTKSNGICPFTTQRLVSFTLR